MPPNPNVSDRRIERQCRDPQLQAGRSEIHEVHDLRTGATTMSSIPSLCDEILKHLTALGRQTARSMLPGLTEPEIRHWTAHLPFVLPDSVVELYKWSAGLRPRSGVGNEFFPGFGMDSLPEMIGMYDELSGAPDFPRFHCGEMHWFPIFRSGGTDFYGVRCAKSVRVDGEVVYDDNEGEHRDGITPPPLEFIGLEAMLKTLLRAYETGVYYVNDRGQLKVGTASYNKEGQLIDVDMSRFKEVARQFNPTLTRWE